MLRVRSLPWPILWALLALVVAGACSSSSPMPTPPTPSAATTLPSTSSTPTASPSSLPSPSPVPSLPAGLPPSFEDDVPAADVPAAALIPLGAHVTGTWSADTTAGEAIVVAWEVPGDDPFVLARGLAVWRRFDDGGAPWRPVWGRAFGVRAGVLTIDAVPVDVTGDGSDDAVVFAGTGGSGGCGAAYVVDLAAGSTIYRRDLCDASLTPSTDPVGLLLTEAVYHPGDPHCCPSAIRRTVLTWDGGGWIEASSEVADV